MDHLCGKLVTQCRTSGTTYVLLQGQFQVNNGGTQLSRTPMQTSLATVHWLHCTADPVSSLTNNSANSCQENRFCTGNYSHTNQWERKKSSVQTFIPIPCICPHRHPKWRSESQFKQQPITAHHAPVLNMQPWEFWSDGSPCCMGPNCSAPGFVI